MTLKKSDLKGKGWWGESKRHSQASLSGWKKRRDRFNRNVGRQGGKHLYIRARQRALNRSDRSVLADRRRTAKIVLDPNNPYEANKYIRNPQRFDLKDSDTKMQKKIVQFKEAEELKGPVNETKIERKRGRRKESKRTKEEIKYVMETTDSSYAQARGLLERAKRKGYSYDTVDWDQIQGKDLTYNEKLERLERFIGKTKKKSEQITRTEIKMQEEKLKHYYQDN